MLFNCPSSRIVFLTKILSKLCKFYMNRQSCQSYIKANYTVEILKLGTAKIIIVTVLKIKQFGSLM